MKIQNSGSTKINILTSDNIRNLERNLSTSEIITPLYIFRKRIIPMITYWTSIMTPYWDSPMTTLWDTPMDSEV